MQHMLYFNRVFTICQSTRLRVSGIQRVNALRNIVDPILMGDLRLERIQNMKEQIYFYERAETHKAKERMFKSFKLANFPGKHPDARMDQ